MRRLPVRVGDSFMAPPPAVLADEPTLRAEPLDLASGPEAAQHLSCGFEDQDALFRQEVDFLSQMLQRRPEM